MVAWSSPPRIARRIALKDSWLESATSLSVISRAGSDDFGG